MRIIRTSAASLVSVVALWGCTPAQQEALRQEGVREAHLKIFGPLHVVSVVVSAVPSGGPSGLHALGMDLVWRSLSARMFELSGSGHSPFDALDPNRSVQIRRRADGVEEIVIR